MANDRKIGVVTVTYNSADVIEEFLTSVMSQTHSNFVLYVIDNDSKDTTLNKVDEWTDERIKVLYNDRNIGVAAGNNQGIKAALNDHCDYIMLLNNDTVFEADMFVELLGSTDEYRVDIVVPKMVYYDNPKKIWFAGGRFVPLLANASRHNGEGEYDSEKYNTARQIEYAPTCCMLLHKDVFSMVGLMDEKYFVYYDDTDFCFRALGLGIKMMYIPKVYLMHKVSSLTGGNLSQFSTRYLTRNKVYYVRKHYNRVSTIFWLGVYQGLFFARLITLRDNFQTFRSKQKAFFEGLSV